MPFVDLGMVTEGARMRRKFKVDRETVVLIVVLLVAVALRFIGVKPGYNQFHSDENAIYSTVVTFIKNNSFEPHRYEYPAVTNYINYVFFKFLFIPLGWFKFLVLNSGQILDGLIKFPLGKDVYNRVFQLEILGPREVNTLFWVRWVTAAFGVGVVWASYLVGRKLFGGFVGLIAAVLVCVNYRQVLNSHLGLPDIYNGFFYLLSFWAILRFRERVSLGRSVVCGTFLGLLLSTKYQWFPFITLFFVCVEQMFRKHNWRGRLSFLISPHLLVIPMMSLMVFLLLNPYLFINIETAVSQMSYASLKYGAGRMNLMPYPYWYLFEIGVGRVTSLLVVLGILLGVLRKRGETALLLSVIMPFFVFFTWYTSGGFYTRNFVSITPLLLVFAAYAIFRLASLGPRRVFVPLAVAVLAFTVGENLSNSLVVLKEYVKPWNSKLIGGWIEKEIPVGAVVAAHSSVPVPDDRVRVVYDRGPESYFSMAEFREAGAEYAIANLEWVSVGFYDWMRPVSSRRWNKPVADMSTSYVALTVDELRDFGLYREVNAWQAPDSNFIAAKVPNYTLLSIENVQDFILDKQKPLSSWKSDPVGVSGWGGFKVRYKMKMETEKAEYKDGAMFLKFYRSKEDALEDKNRVAVRLSARDSDPGVWVSKEFLGRVSQEAGWAVLGFCVNDAVSATFYLGEVELKKAEVKEDLGGREVVKLGIDDDVLFPNSHGNL